MRSLTPQPAKPPLKKPLLGLSRQGENQLLLAPFPSSCHSTKTRRGNSTADHPAFPHGKGHHGAVLVVVGLLRCPPPSFAPQTGSGWAQGPFAACAGQVALPAYETRRLQHENIPRSQAGAPGDSR